MKYYNILFLIVFIKLVYILISYYTLSFKYYL